MKDLADLDTSAIIDSLSDGVYVCDLDRRIVYWNESAERITGWSAEDVVGRQCFDNVLCHVDKDGHALCGEEYCPLHRSMVTGTGSKGSLLVFAKGKNGQRVPMEVAVAPIYNDAGETIGGVETFRDASTIVHDLERARAIQQLAVAQDIPEDPRIRFATHYIPHDMVGGDYYAIRRLGADQYGLLLADVMGHGVAAALYTMHLSQLLERYHTLLADPVGFAVKMNNELVKIVRTDSSFATAVCGVVDLDEGVFRLTAAGGPHVLLIHADGTYECLESSGLPLGVVEDPPYQELSTNIRQGDRLLLYSDGAVEIDNADGRMLGTDGLVEILRSQGYPESGIDMGSLEEELLKYSNSIRLDDDLTLIEARFR
jgi:PAS domain S-box-containing protein